MDIDELIGNRKTLFFFSQCFINAILAELRRLLSWFYSPPSAFESAAITSPPALVIAVSLLPVFW